ncbi:hypothetical protein GCK72_008225 [Caenorhabditis remanei]|uniref:Uncharacterized protein n=1 Tax=Caenorhabditis remanei TaxID=31234 RepID=A0A6A5GWX7_CAERE|nr:hypothetical protein GCK72_008225 [Caenorhabditis remanei]KAF1759980.1 hypothetical protein GCK72_008225 [Caenorhabditis remanei]
MSDASRIALLKFRSHSPGRRSSGVFVSIFGDSGSFTSTFVDSGATSANLNSIGVIPGACGDLTSEFTTSEVTGGVGGGAEIVTSGGPHDVFRIGLSKASDRIGDTSIIVAGVVGEVGEETGAPEASSRIHTMSSSSSAILEREEWLENGEIGSVSNYWDHSFLNLIVQESDFRIVEVWKEVAPIRVFISVTDRQDLGTTYHWMADSFVSFVTTGCLDIIQWEAAKVTEQLVNEKKPGTSVPQLDLMVD